MAVDLLVAVGVPLMPLQHEAEAGIERAAVAGVQPVAGVLAHFSDGSPSALRRNGRGDHVECAADGVWALDDGGWPLEDFKGGHAPRGGEIVGGRRGIRRRGDEHAVFEQRDARAALRGHAADADVGAQPEAVLQLDRHARHLAHDLLHVRVRESGKLFGADEVGAAGDAVDILAGADDGDGFDSDALAVCGFRLLALRERLALRECLNVRKHGAQDEDGDCAEHRFPSNSS